MTNKKPIILSLAYKVSARELGRDGSPEQVKDYIEKINAAQQALKAKKGLSFSNPQWKLDQLDAEAADIFKGCVDAAVAGNTANLKAIADDVVKHAKYHNLFGYYFSYRGNNEVSLEIEKRKLDVHQTITLAACFPEGSGPRAVILKAAASNACDINGSAETLRLLVQAGVDVQNSQLLYTAGVAQNRAVVEALYQLGADVKGVIASASTSEYNYDRAAGKYLQMFLEEVEGPSAAQSEKRISGLEATVAELTTKLAAAESEIAGLKNAKQAPKP